MLDIGWQELLVIGALALIVVGPKDLPGLLRTLGQWVGRIRGMAREFQRTMNDAARETDLGNFKELSDFKRQLESKNFDTDAPAKSSTGKVTKADPLAEFEAAKTAPADDTDDPGALAEDDTPKTGPVTRTAPVDKPDPAAMGNAMPATDTAAAPEAATSNAAHKSADT